MVDCFADFLSPILGCLAFGLLQEVKEGRETLSMCRYVLCGAVLSLSYERDKSVKVHNTTLLYSECSNNDRCRCIGALAAP